MIEIKDADTSLAQMLNMEHLSEETKGRTADAAILLYPDAERLFQPNTINFFKYVRQQAPFCKIEVLENIEDMKVLVLYTTDIRMPFIMVPSQDMLPVVVNLASDYALEAVKGSERQNTVHLQITVENQERARTIAYEGSPEDLRPAFESIDLQKMWEV